MDIVIPYSVLLSFFFLENCFGTVYFTIKFGIHKTNLTVSFNYLNRWPNYWRELNRPRIGEFSGPEQHGMWWVDNVGKTLGPLEGRPKTRVGFSRSVRSE